MHPLGASCERGLNVRGGAFQGGQGDERRPTVKVGLAKSVPWVVLDLLGVPTLGVRHHLAHLMVGGHEHEVFHRRLQVRTGPKHMPNESTPPMQRRASHGPWWPLECRPPKMGAEGSMLDENQTF